MKRGRKSGHNGHGGHGRGKRSRPVPKPRDVPGAFVGAAADMLNEIARYVLDVSPVHPGETLQLYDDPFAVVGFRRIPPGTSGTVHDADVLRVTFLC